MAKYWFKRRRYGYGWYPATWHGWLTVAVYIVFLTISAFLLPVHPDNLLMLYYMLFVFSSTILLIVISYVKGPKPKWRWGKSPSDNPEEDF